MFDQFFADIGSAYDDVSSFFDEILGDSKSTVLDAAKDVLTKNIGGGTGSSTDSSSKEDSVADILKAFSISSPIASGYGGELEKVVEDTSAPQAVDADALERMWYSHMKSLATKGR